MPQKKGPGLGWSLGLTKETHPGIARSAEKRTGRPSPWRGVPNKERASLKKENPPKKKIPPKRKNLDIRFPDPTPRRKFQNAYKPLANISGWMEAEGITPTAIFNDNGETADFLRSNLEDPYSFVMMDIIFNRPAPQANKDGKHIKREFRRISYFSYVVQRKSFELCLWHLLQSDFPKETNGYYRGYKEEKTLEDLGIKEGESYWIVMADGLLAPVRMQYFDDKGRAWIGLATDRNNNAQVRVRTADRFRFL